MPISITSPTATNLDLNKPVDFTGTASENIVSLRFISPFASNSFILGRTDVLDGQWSFSYLFNTGGQRELEILGLDEDGEAVEATQITFELEQQPDDFSFPTPSIEEQIRDLTLYATHYNAHLASDTADGNPLLDLSGNTLGPKLSDRDWCQAALEGTVRVDTSTYNYAGTGQGQQVDCSSFFPRLSSRVIFGTNRVRFKISNGPFGEGAEGFILVPYRSIAVDRNFIDLGSVVYIPDAKGKRIRLPSGQMVAHDGYFFAADVGGAINGNHIDVFLGITANRGQLTFIKSVSSGTFSASLIKNPKISQVLKSMHSL